jgi:hypothetical protein
MLYIIYECGQALAEDGLGIFQLKNWNWNWRTYDVM